MATKTWTSKTDFEDGILSDVEVPAGLHEVRLKSGKISGDGVWVFDAGRVVKWMYFNASEGNYGYPDAWDLLNEDCSDISDWVDGDTGTAVSEVDPAGQFRFDTNKGAAGNAKAVRTRTLSSPPNKFTVEIKTYFDALGAIWDIDNFPFYYHAATWAFVVIFASDGLFVRKAGVEEYTEVGTNIVKCGGSAAWQTWRFKVDKSGGEGSATVEVFLDDVSQGTVDCDYETAGNDGACRLRLSGYTTDDLVAHIDYLKIGNTYDYMGETRTITYQFWKSANGSDWDGPYNAIGDVPDSRYIKIKASFSRDYLVGGKALEDMTVTYETRHQPIFI